MITSLVPSEPFDPSADEISDATFTYFNTRNRMRAFTLVNQEFDRSGLNKAQLARRMKKGQDRISHLLNAPGNLTLDTLSELLLAISGAVVSYSLLYPLQKGKSQSVIQVRSSPNDKSGNITISSGSHVNTPPMKITNFGHSPDTKPLELVT